MTMPSTQDMIQLFSLKKLSNALFGSFMEAFDKLILEATVEKLGILPADYQQFKTQLGALVDANLTVRKNPLSKELSDLDAHRDALIKHFFDKVRGDKHSPLDPAISTAANALWDRLSGYHGVWRKSFREESHLINGFLTDAKKSENLDQIKVLRLEALLPLLEQANTKFEETMATRAKEEETVIVGQLKQIREALSLYYGGFTKKVSAMNVLTPTETTTAFVGHVNKLIADTTTAYRQHKAQLGLWTKEGGREEEGAEPEAGKDPEVGTDTD